jgi:hypothetical protein
MSHRAHQFFDEELVHDAHDGREAHVEATGDLCAREGTFLAKEVEDGGTVDAPHQAGSS